MTQVANISFCCGHEAGARILAQFFISFYSRADERAAHYLGGYPMDLPEAFDAILSDDAIVEELRSGFLDDVLNDPHVESVAAEARPFLESPIVSDIAAANGPHASRRLRPHRLRPR
jgi:hypothetical protein